MKKYIALDIGLKRVGMAFAAGLVVVPLAPVLRKNRNQAARDVSECLREYAPDVLVVGVPLGGASEEEMGRRVRHFVGLLEFAGEVVYQDEAMSSVEASELHTDTARDGRLDSVAAMVILKRYLRLA